MSLARIRRFAAAVAAAIAARQVSLVAAGVAFYAMLALFPGLTALVALWGIFADPAAVRVQVDALSPVMPADVHRILSDQLVAISSARVETLGWAGILSLALSLWSARAGVSAVIQALNSVHGIRPRSGLGHYRAAMGLTLALIVFAIVALVAIVVAPVVLSFLPLGRGATLAVEAVRWGLVLSVMTLGTGLVYRYGPNRRGRRLPWITPGAVIAICLWIVVSAGFSHYLASFGNYNKIYGSLGAVVALLMWLYLSAFLLLFGAVVDAEIEKQRSAAPTGRAADRPG